MNEDLLKCLAQIVDFPTIYRTGNRTPLDIMRQSGYPRLFSAVTMDLISNHIADNSKVIENWIQYSEDIRHSPAWSFASKDGKWRVTYFGKKGSRMESFTYDNKIEACAKMIKIMIEEVRIDDSEAAQAPNKMYDA